MSLVDSGDASTHCPILFSRSTDFSSPLQKIANFGVRVYVSIVAGGPLTTSILCESGGKISSAPHISPAIGRLAPAAPIPPYTALLKVFRAVCGSVGSLGSFR